MIFAALILAACGGVTLAYYPQGDEYLISEHIEPTLEPTPEPESEPTPAPEPTPQLIALEHPVWEISEYGRQVAKEFLSQMTSIFSHGEVYWE